MASSASLPCGGAGAHVSFSWNRSLELHICPLDSLIISPVGFLTAVMHR